MAAFDANQWYVLTNALQTANNTLTAANNTQAAFDPNSPSAIYYAPVSSTVPDSQLWQLFPVNTSTASAYIFRNRAIGPDAYLTTAWTTRKCGGGSCATVPVMAPNLNAESLWNFGSWGFSDPTGGAFLYNLGNGSTWIMDVMDGGTGPELLNYDQTNRLGSHWTLSAYRNVASADATGFSALPTAATSLLAQFTDTSGTSVTPYTTAVAATIAATPSVTSAGVGASSTITGASSASHQHSGLSTGSAIGIGVGLGVGCTILLVSAALFFFSYRKRRGIDTSKGPSSLPADDQWKQQEQLDYSSKPATETVFTEMESPPPPGHKEPKSVELMHPSEQVRSELSGDTASNRERAELSSSPSIQMHGSWSNA